MKKLFYFILLFIVLVIGAYYYLRSNEMQDYKGKGIALITEIEEFRNQNGRLPNNLDELNLSSEMGEGPYYEKLNSKVYSVYFNIGFDTKYIYQSDQKSWRKGP